MCMQPVECLPGCAGVRWYIWLQILLPPSIGVRDGGQGWALAPPPIRAVWRHYFGQRVEIIRAKHNTCLIKTNLGSVSAVNGKNFWYYSLEITKNFWYYPPPSPHRIWSAANNCHSGKTRFDPPNGCWPVRLDATIHQEHVPQINPDWLTASLLVYPGQVLGYPGIDPWLFWQTTSLALTGDPSYPQLVSNRAQQGTARITL